MTGSDPTDKQQPPGRNEAHERLVKGGLEERALFGFTARRISGGPWPTPKWCKNVRPDLFLLPPASRVTKLEIKSLGASMRIILAIVLSFIFTGCGSKPTAQAPESPPSPVAGAPSDPLKLTDPREAQMARQLDRLADEQAFPIPQNPARSKQLAEAYLDWYRDLTSRAFDKVGDTKAAAAEKTRAALDAWAVDRAIHQHRGLDDYVAQARADEAIRAAAAAGASDPLFNYIRHQMEKRVGTTDPIKSLPQFRSIVVALCDSKYPAMRKIHAALNLIAALGTRLMSREDFEELELWNKRYWELFEEAASDPNPITQQEVESLAAFREELKNGTAVLERKKNYSEIAAHLTRAKAPKYTQLVVRGAFLYRSAWDARGSGSADTVTEQGWKDFTDRLVEAENVLTAAWDIDPNSPTAPTGMLIVCKGLSRDRTTFEVWFERAMTLNPDNYPACVLKLDYLHPKWHGTWDDFMGFGWQCVRTRNTAGGLPFAPIVAHHMNEPYIGSQFDQFRIKSVFHYSKLDVWTEVNAALGIFLQDRPDDPYIRSLRARLACIAYRFELADQELESLAGTYSRLVFEGPAEYELFRKWAKAQIPPGLGVPNKGN